MDGRGRYQLRKAAGLYWLLDMEQTGAGRRDPVVLNESGAYIWKRYGELQSEAAVAEELNREYGIPVSEALADVRQFLGQLQGQGLVIR